MVVVHGGCGGGWRGGCGRRLRSAADAGGWGLGLWAVPGKARVPPQRVPRPSSSTWPGEGTRAGGGWSALTQGCTGEGWGGVGFEGWEGGGIGMVGWGGVGWG